MDGLTLKCTQQWIQLSCGLLKQPADFSGQSHDNDFGQAKKVTFLVPWMSVQRSVAFKVPLYHVTQDISCRCRENVKMTKNQVCSDRNATWNLGRRKRTSVVTLTLKNSAFIPNWCDGSSEWISVSIIMLAMTGAIAHSVRLKAPRNKINPQGVDDDALEMCPMRSPRMKNGWLSIWIKYFTTLRFLSLLQALTEIVPPPQNFQPARIGKENQVLILPGKPHLVKGQQRSVAAKGRPEVLAPGNSGVKTIIVGRINSSKAKRQPWTIHLVLILTEQNEFYYQCQQFEQSSYL